MQFLNPLLLFALPLVLLPIVIHLLNQRRHRTVAWGAMQFLLSAKKMSRGMARLRQWLIMAARMLIIAGLIFAISRPLSSGWVGSLTGGKPETIILLLDRSASMQQQQMATGQTKLSTGVKKIAAALQTLVGKKPLVLIESTENRASTITQPNDLLDLPATTGTESQADIAAMVQTALDYISDNEAGRTDVWICSDAASNDWNAENSRWKSLNSGFSKLEGVRFQVLNFADATENNLGISVDRVDRVTSNDRTELVIDVTVVRAGQDLSPATIPLTFTINGVRSVIELEIEGQSASLTGHRIAVEDELESGWGQVELPADANVTDNAWYFAFSDPVARKTVCVSEKKRNTRGIELAAATTVDSNIEFEATHIPPDDVGDIDWQATTMLVWQAPLPDEKVALQIERFAQSGRTVIFLPPEDPDDRAFAGIQWDQWRRAKGAGTPISFWNNDEDLLAKTRDGQPLPVDELLVYRQCDITDSQPDATRLLAKTGDNDPLLVRRRAGGGAIYFLTTLPVATHSSLDREGITLFAMTHRAIANAAESQGTARQFDAGTLPARDVAKMKKLNSTAATEAAIANLAAGRPFRAGVYGDEEQLIALNRPLAEDRGAALAAPQLDTLFNGLNYTLIDDSIGSSQALTSEVWRFFVAMMGVALLLEAILCLPPKPVEKVALSSAAQPTGNGSPSDSQRSAA